MRLKDVLTGNARKVFGKKEIGIILKQLDGIHLTQSEKNRLSRDIRPKLKFIREISKFEDDFELKKGADTQKIIDKAVRIILKDELKKSIKAILLFGSHAGGIVTIRSDIDICVVFKNQVSSKEATKFRIRISGQLPDKMDIQVFNVLPQKIKKEIARKHRVIYEGSEYDDVNFSIRHLKDNDYFTRMARVFG